MNLSKENYFSSIDDIILKNWWRAIEGDHSACRIDPAIGSKEMDEEYWILIHDSYIREFGLGTEFERIMDIKKQIALLECDLVITDVNYIKNQIRMLENELEEIFNRPVRTDRDGLVIILEKWLGFRINENEITARKFLKILKEYEKEIEMVNKMNA